MPRRKVVTGSCSPAGSLAGSVLVRRRAARNRSTSISTPPTGRCTPSRTDRPRRTASCRSRRTARAVVTRRRARRRAPRRGLPRGRLRPPLGPPLEVLPRQVPLRDAPRPACAARPAIAAAVREHEPEAIRLAGPELGAVALAAAASLESGLPFLIVRKEAKDYGTSNRLEGVFEAGSASASSRTSSPPAERRSRRSRRSATPGLQVSNAVCVVDREEGGHDALARACRAPAAALRASELLKSARKSAWLSDIRPRC